jgi:hypothetical protein
MVSSAGILPFSRDERGNVVFLLGKDIRDGVFSDFGGKIEAIDQNDPVNTATREFYEESLGILCNSPYDLRKRVRELSVCLFGSTKNQHVYRMYVLEVPYYKDLPQRFKKVVSFLRYKNIGTNHIEKTELVWCTFDELLRIPKRKVFVETLHTNIHFVKRLLVESWRSLCEEFKQCSSLPVLSGSSPTPGSGRYILPMYRESHIGSPG